MDRLVNAPLEEFAQFFGKPVNWRDAAYPPGCRPARGRFETVLAPAGGLILHVMPCSFAAPSFRLSVLFGTGTGVFPTAADMFSFWHGELAKAFGIEVLLELPEPEPVVALRSSLDVDAPLDHPSSSDGSARSRCIATSMTRA